MRRSRLVRAMWWFYMIAPPLNLADTIETGMTAHSADEVYGGLGVVVLPLLVAMVIALVLLIRVAIRWSRTPKPQRLEELVVGLAFVPFILVWASSELVAWPDTRTATTLAFVEAIGITVAWVVAVFSVRRALTSYDAAMER